MEARRAALLLACAATLAGCGDRAPPNVLLVSVDTLRVDAVGAYGSPVPTPTLDALAQGGVLFENAIVPAPATGPSHATLLTGVGVSRHGVTENGVPLSPQARTLAEALGAAGYATGAFVSSFVLDPRFGWTRGFDAYDATFSKRGETIRRRIGFARGHALDGYDRRAPQTNLPALAWLASAPEPFFLFVHYFDPHAPYAGPPDLVSRVPAGYARRRARARLPLVRREVPEITLPALVAIIRHYHAEVLLVDAALAELVEALDARGSRERTLVVVTADHGEGLGQHGSLGHAHHLYEEQVRVPLLFHWPVALPRGLRVGSLVGLVDVAPTIAELAGIRLEAADGRSFAPALRAGRDPEARPLVGRRQRYERPIAGHRGQKFFVRDPRWKYIRATHDPDELYDLAEDPDESRNLHETRTDEVARLAALLDAHLAARPEPLAHPPLSEEVRRGLEALGYGEGGADSAAPE